MGDPVWDSGNQELLAKICEQERAEANAFSGSAEPFRALHQALTKNGPLNADSLLVVAQNNNIKAEKADIEAIFSRYDADKNANLELKEFAAWWSGASDGLSVLLRNALSEAILQPGQIEQWRRGNNIRFDVTAGKVDDTFEAKSGIYLTVVPSSSDNLKALAGDTDSLPQAVATAKLTVKDSASDEEVQQLIDLINVVTDEMTQAQGAPFKLQLGKAFENGKRYLTVNATVLNAPKDPSKLVNHFATLAGLKDKALFRRVMLGIEFGADGNRIFSPMPEGGLAELFENFRLTANFEYDDALLKMLTVLSLQPDGLDEDALVKLLAVTFLARGARSVHATANFRSYKQVLDELIETISKIPLTSRKAKDSEELYKQAMAAQILRMRLEAVASIRDVRSTIFNALPMLEMVYGEVPEPGALVQIQGIEGAGKSTLIEKLGAQPNGPYFAKRRVYFDKKPNKQRLMVVESDGPFCPMSSAIVVVVLDASSEERLSLSLRHASVRITNTDALSPDQLIFIVSKAGNGGVGFDKVKKLLQTILEANDDEIAQQCFQFDGSSVPAELTAIIDDKIEDCDDAEMAAAFGGGDDEDDEDDEDGPDMAAIAKKAYKGASKVVAGLEDIEVTNSIASVHLIMQGLPFGETVAETDPEKITRNRMEFNFRIMSIMEFSEGVTSVDELAEAWTGEEEEKKEKLTLKAPTRKTAAPLLVASDDSDSSDDNNSCYSASSD